MADNQPTLPPGWSFVDSSKPAQVQTKKPVLPPGWSFVDKKIDAASLPTAKERIVSTRARRHGREERDISQFPTTEEELKSFPTGDIGIRKSYLLGRQDDDPEAFLEQMKKFYPDARYIEPKERSSYDEQRFVGFTDPETGQRQVIGADTYRGINPMAYEAGDIAPVALPGLGGTLGAILPAVVGGGLTAASVPATAGTATGPLAALTAEGALIGGALGGTAGTEIEQGIANLLGANDPRGIIERLGDAATETAAGIAVPKVLGSIYRGASNVARPLFRKGLGISKNALEKAKAYLEGTGEVPLLSTISDSGLLKGTEEALSRIPGAIGRYSQKATRTLQGVKKRLSDLVDEAGGGELTGEEIQESIVKSARSGSAAHLKAKRDVLSQSRPDININNTAQNVLELIDNTSPETRDLYIGPIAGRHKKLFDYVDSEIEKKAELAARQHFAENPLPSVRELYDRGIQTGTPEKHLDRFVADELRKIQEEVVNKFKGQIREGIKAGKSNIDVLADPNSTAINVSTDISYPKLKGKTGAVALEDFKDQIGKAFSQRNISNVEREYLHRLYNSIKSDVSSSLPENVRPQYQQLLAEGERYQTKVKPSIEKLLGRKVSDVRDVEDLEKDAYNEIVSAINKGDKRLEKLFRAIPDKKIQKAIAGRHLAELGSPAPGEFSAQTFFENWRKLPKTSKDTLYGKNEFGSFRRDLDKVADIMGDVAEATKERSLSGPAKILGTLGGIGAVTGAGFIEPTYAVIAAATPYVSSKLLTSPHFVKWLAGFPLKELDITKYADRKRFANYASRLLTQSFGGDKDVQEAAKEFYGSLAASLEDLIEGTAAPL